MDLTLSKEDLQFREEVRAFLDEAVTEEILEAGEKTTSVFAPFEAAIKWQKVLHEKGWVAPNWPKEFGGTGWSETQRYVFTEECLKKGVPPLLPMGLLMCGPMIIGCGTEEQKEKYLPRILSGEDFWCQGYSEPGAGSDLAALQCKAVSDGDDYVINGTKIWTTYAHHANMMFLLVRTSNEGKPQQGITFLLLDMSTPGIEVEPIYGLDGVPEQCQVFFTDVRVPKTNRVGEENQGWTVAKYLLEFERGGSSYGPSMQQGLKKLKYIAEQQAGGYGGTLLDDPVFSHKIADLEVDILAVEFSEKRIMSALSRGQNPGPISSMLKIKGTEVTQRLTELLVEALDIEALPQQLDALQPGSGVPAIGPNYGLTVMPYYLNTRAASIYGGSNEIQRGIIAKAVLGL